jgi:hypothetical protein
MAAAGVDAAQAEDRAAAAVTSLEESLREREAALQGALTAAYASAEELEAAVYQARDEAEAAGEDLQWLFQELRARVEERMQRMLGHVRETCDSHVALVEQLGDALQGQVGSMAGTVTDRATTDVAELQAAVGPAVEALASLAGALEAAAQTVTSETDALCESYGVLTGKVGPLMSGVGAVREAASRVGVAWP